jgi:hypothetical protein
MRVTIYDLQDRPIATIDEDFVIRLYNGHAVGTLIDGVIAGWNGNAIGEIRNDSVFNSSNQKIGSTTSKKHSAPPYRPLADYNSGVSKTYVPGSQQINPINPINDPSSLEDVLRSGGAREISPLNFPGENLIPPDQP